MANLKQMAVDLGDEIKAQNRLVDRIVAKTDAGPCRGAWTSQTARRSSPAVEDEPVPVSTEAAPVRRGAHTKQTARISTPIVEPELPPETDSAEPVPVRRGGTRTRQTARRSTGGKAPRKMLASSSLQTTEDEIAKDGLESGTFTTETAGKSVGGAAPFLVRILVGVSVKVTE